MQRSVVIVGAGLAGLTCAKELAALGHAPLVLDKGRRPGGRSCSRKDEDGRLFDHGAQFFTARDPWTAARIAEWHEAGVVAPWQPRGAHADHPQWWVATPCMGALAEHLALGLDVRCSIHVTAVTKNQAGWHVETRDSTFEADTLVMAIPAPQAAALLGERAPPGDTDACWAAMVRLSEGAAVDVLERKEGPFSWAAREASKPGRSTRPGEDLWTVHASAEWSQAHLEQPAEWVAHQLSAALADTLSQSVLGAQAHRWRYAKPRVDTPVGCHVDAEAKLIVCGDWLQSPRVEGALTSGRAAAQRWAELR